MAIFNLTGTASGNLVDYPAQDFGYESDTVTVAANWTPASGFLIATYECADTINTSAHSFTGTKCVIFSGEGADTVTGGNGVEQVFDGSNFDYKIGKLGGLPAGSISFPTRDIINLAGGDDIMEVGSGDDTYNGGSHNSGDWLMFRHQNTDGVNALLANPYAVTVDLAKTTAQDWDGASNVNHFGTDIISGFENCVGGNGGDTIYGTAGVNFLFGGAGGDALYGRGGNDKVFGGVGVDTLVGGGGADGIYCTGAANNASDTASRDTVVYNNINDSGPAGPQRDTIYYFDRGGGANDDKISFAAFDGDTRVSAPGDQQLVWRGFATSFGTDARGELRLEDLGSHILIHVDLDGDAADEMAIYVFNVPTMTQADFIL